MKAPCGSVVAITVDSVIIDVDALPACQRCARGKGCGAGLLSGDERKRRIEVPRPAEMNLAAGDRVVLELSSRTVLRAATYAYGLPLLIMMVALGLGSSVAGPLDEVTAILLAGAGLLTGMAISRWRLSDACPNAYMPAICAVSLAANEVDS